MKAIININYSQRVTASIRYFSNERKVVKTLDGLNTGVAIGKPKDLAAILRSEHHDPTACKEARTFILSAQTPDKPTPEQLQMIDAALEKAFFDFKAEVGGISMIGWIHGDTKTRHLHGIMPNSNGDRGLNFTPDFLSKLQSFFGLLLSSQGAAKAVVKRYQFIHMLKKSLSATWPAISPTSSVPVTPSKK